MIWILLHFLFAFALPSPSGSNKKISKATATTSSASNTTTSTKASTNPTTFTTYSEKFDSSTLCVECYDKFVSKDCKTCKCVCDNKDAMNVTCTRTEDGRQCPRNPEEVPCECKNSKGRVEPNVTCGSKVVKPSLFGSHLN